MALEVRERGESDCPTAFFISEHLAVSLHARQRRFGPIGVVVDRSGYLSCRPFGADRALLLIEGVAIAKVVMLGVADPFRRGRRPDDKSKMPRNANLTSPIRHDHRRAAMAEAAVTVSTIVCR
jgi:hypothetical protein